MLKHAIRELQRGWSLSGSAALALAKRRRLTARAWSRHVTDVTWRGPSSPWDEFDEPGRDASATRLLRAVLGGVEGESSRKRISEARDHELQTVVMQMLLRNNVAEYGYLRRLLPDDEEWKGIVEVVASHGHERESLHDYHHILSGPTDEERCARLIKCNRPVPEFMFRFLLRNSSEIHSIETLDALIESCPIQFWSREPWGARGIDSPEKALVHNHSRFGAVVLPLAIHTYRLEPRLIIKMARIAARYIEDITVFAGTSRRVFNIQCRVFNKALSLFQPRAHHLPIHRRYPNAYFWEAQRIILNVCEGKQEPPLVDQTGFRAIRSVLAGQAHDLTDVHNVARHLKTWPPYLQPADGIDEMAYPEASLSRAVNAGILMQEAGFAMTDEDDALDVLQGRSTDGTPTIRQRSSNHSGLGVWTASIKATRNATEAWARFRNPPDAAMEPGLPQYTVMFHKLTLPDAEMDGTVLAGHKALNFPTNHDVNLTEFEKARLRPPSMAELYRQMLLSGIRPQDTCLRILVANAESLETAHQYLRDSTVHRRVVACLTAEYPDLEEVRKIPMELFAAYMQACTQVPATVCYRPLKRAMRLAEVELDPAARRWTPHIWGIVLKGLSKPDVASEDTLQQHMYKAQYVMDRIHESNGMSVSAFVQFCKCVRKLISREIPQLLRDLEVGTLGWAMRGKGWKGQWIANLLPAICPAVRRMKEEFRGLMEREKVSQALLGDQPVTALDRMLCRTDAMSSQHLHEYVLSLAHAGELQEMVAALRWMMREWSQPDVMEQMAALDDPPPEGNLFETLCAYRYLAEPLVGVEETEALRRDAEAMEWAWPDEEAVEAWERMQWQRSTTKQLRDLLHASWPQTQDEADGGWEAGGRACDVGEM
ncbi:hypothetical protein XA68_16599 [Ophiocordyceps unilateralis]|uniref:Uncharacterized protein n=1 Tax=Ophiocordyceps unilateralis TaxID=268505 RepID=A0A2A9P690_OPHUN|nr:hypothetical protein XA68_16599 [Ophiocordyceps unilateralis]